MQAWEGDELTGRGIVSAILGPKYDGVDFL